MQRGNVIRCLFIIIMWVNAHHGEHQIASRIKHYQIISKSSSV